jgi:hypothetical protein
VARQALAHIDKAMLTIAALLRLADVEYGPKSSKFHTIDLSAICAPLHPIDRIAYRTVDISFARGVMVDSTGGFRPSVLGRVIRSISPTAKCQNLSRLRCSRESTRLRVRWTATQKIPMKEIASTKPSAARSISGCR